MRASDTLMRQNMRRLRIQPLLHEILNIVSKHLSDEDYRNNAMREIQDELFNKLYLQGIEIISDYTRAEIGLPPRGEDGWTRDELVALEQKRLEMLMHPLSLVAPSQTLLGKTE